MTLASRSIRKAFSLALAITLPLAAAAVFTGCGQSEEKTESESKAEAEKKGAEDLRKGKAAYAIRDYKTAAMHFSLAAQDGNAEAQYMLSTCFLNGYGVEKDKIEGIKWLRKAADQDFAKALFMLAVFYSQNDEDKAKPVAEKAVPGLKKAAEAGDAEAQLMLGSCYMDGYCVEKDKKEGVKWFRKAADQDLAQAQLMLGDCYLRGNGVEKEKKEGVKWVRKAADHGLAEAQLMLGDWYMNGDVVEKDLQEAKEWLEKAAKQGNESANVLLKELERELEEDCPSRY